LRNAQKVRCMAMAVDMIATHVTRKPVFGPRVFLCPYAGLNPEETAMSSETTSTTAPAHDALAAWDKLHTERETLNGFSIVLTTRHSSAVRQGTG
jgi:hypothetical protein